LLPFGTVAAAFEREEALRDFLLKGWKEIPQLRGLKPVGREHVLGNRRRIDVLCRDQDDNALVVVELKSNNAGDRLASQLYSYLSQLSAENPGKTVRGLVICGPNDRLDGRSITAGFPWRVDWYRYSFDLFQA
jgi:RecB family endonuclease NucS